MYNVMLITLRETSGCLSQQPYGKCLVTCSSRCAVPTVRLFIKHRGCVQSAYLSNNPYTLTATGLQAGRSRGFNSGAGKGFLFFSGMLRSVLGNIQPRIQWVTVVLHPGVKRLAA